MNETRNRSKNMGRKQHNKEKKTIILKTECFDNIDSAVIISLAYTAAFTADNDS